MFHLVNKSSPQIQIALPGYAKEKSNLASSYCKTDARKLLLDYSKATPFVFTRLFPALTQYTKTQATQTKVKGFNLSICKPVLDEWVRFTENLQQYDQVSPRIWYRTHVKCQALKSNQCPHLE